MSRPAPDPATAELLAAVRRVRFRHGRRCPHCRATRVQGWGRFAGRRRYRCTACRRTFSDLTATPAARSAKPWLWTACYPFVLRGTTIRRSAARLGVAPSTAFRWRHALLDGLRARDTTTLSGAIELDTLLFLLSQKGQRGLTRRPFRHGRRTGLATARPGVNVVVLVAADQERHTFTAVTHWRTRRPGAFRLEECLADRLRRPLTLVVEDGPLGGAATLARRMGVGFRDVRPGPRRSRGRDAPSPPDLPESVAYARAYGRRLKGWLRRFRGVATRYLPNYLQWHRFLERHTRGQARSASTSWSGQLRRPTGRGAFPFAPDQHSPRTERNSRRTHTSWPPP